MKRILVGLILFLGFISARAQIIEPIKWSFDAVQNGDEVELKFIADIETNWHLYDTYLPDGGPIATAIIYNDSSKFSLLGELLKEPEPEEHFDNTFQLNLRYFSNKAILTQKIKLNSSDPVSISGYVTFMGCDDEQCLPPNDAEFTFHLNKSAKDTSTKMETEPSQGSAGEGKPFGFF